MFLDTEVSGHVVEGGMRMEVEAKQQRLRWVSICSSMLRVAVILSIKEQIWKSKPINHHSVMCRPARCSCMLRVVVVLSSGRKSSEGCYDLADRGAVSLSKPINHGQVLCRSASCSCVVSEAGMLSKGTKSIIYDLSGRFGISTKTVVKYIEEQGQREDGRGQNIFRKESAMSIENKLVLMLLRSSKKIDRYAIYMHEEIQY